MRPGWSWASHPRIWAGADGGWSGYPPSPPASPLPNTTAAGARPGGAGPCQAPGATLCHVVPRSALPSPAACLPPGTAQRPQGTPTPPVLHPASCCRAEELATGQTPPPAPLAAPHTLGANPGWRTKAASCLPSPGCVGKPGAAQCPQFSHPHLCPALPGSPVPTGGSTPAPHGTAPSIRHSPRAGLEPLCGTCVCTHLLPGLI